MIYEDHIVSVFVSSRPRSRLENSRRNGWIKQVAQVESLQRGAKKHALKLCLNYLSFHVSGTLRYKVSCVFCRLSLLTFECWNDSSRMVRILQDIPSCLTCSKSASLFFQIEWTFFMPMVQSFPTLCIIWRKQSRYPGFVCYYVCLSKKRAIKVAAINFLNHFIPGVRSLTIATRRLEYSSCWLSKTQ